MVPDLENLCRTYLYHRDQGEHDKADFVVLELLDQCVRRQSGGELGRYYRRPKADPLGNASIAFVRDRTGEDLVHSPLPAELALYPSAATRLCRAPLDPGRDPAAAACLP